MCTQDLDFIISVDPYWLRIFCDSLILQYALRSSSHPWDQPGSKNAYLTRTEDGCGQKFPVKEEASKKRGGHFGNALSKISGILFGLRKMPREMLSEIDISCPTFTLPSSMSCHEKRLCAHLKFNNICTCPPPVNVTLSYYLVNPLWCFGPVC